MGKGFKKVCSMISQQVKELRKYAEEYKNLPWSEVCEKTKRMLNCAADTIEELSAKVARQNAEPVRCGKWIKTGVISGKCSECEEISVEIGKYCPNCGAKMEEESTNV